MSAVTLMALAVPVAALPLAVLLWASALPGMWGGWVWTSVLGGAGEAAVAWLIWNQRPGRPAAVAVAVVAGAALGIWVAHVAPLSAGRLGRSLNSVPMPRSFVKIADEPGGSHICADECTYVTRTWIVPGTQSEVERTITESFSRGGFTLQPWDNDPSDRREPEVKGRRSRLSVSIELVSRGVLIGSVSVPPGHIGVRAIIGQ